MIQSSTRATQQHVRYGLKSRMNHASKCQTHFPAKENQEVTDSQAY